MRSAIISGNFYELLTLSKLSICWTNKCCVCATCSFGTRRLLTALQFLAKISNVRMHRSGVCILLVAICGISMIVGHTDRNFQPRSAVANQSSIITDSSAPKLNRAKRVAIYNGQGVVKVITLNSKFDVH